MTHEERENAILKKWLLQVAGKVLIGVGFLGLYTFACANPEYELPWGLLIFSGVVFVGSIACLRISDTVEIEEVIE